MKQDDARLAVLGEYDGWAKDHPNDAKMMGGFVFFSYLQQEKPDLLDFRGGVGSKWQIVHLWLRDAGRLEVKCLEKVGSGILLTRRAVWCGLCSGVVTVVCDVLALLRGRRGSTTERR
jgi:hypothetical protein